MTGLASRTLACLAGAALLLAFLHTWAARPAQWVLLDADRELLAVHDTKAGCWRDGAGRFAAERAFTCRIK